MAIVKATYTKSKSAAKAHIRYIQHRPGRSAEPAQRHHRHFFCCGPFAESCDILGVTPTLALALSPEHGLYHSRLCETFTAYYRDEQFSLAEKKFSLHNNVSAQQPASGERKPGSVQGIGKERITRTLFGSDGAMGKIDAYRMIDNAEQGSVFFRFILSPDPKGEDSGKDLHLWDVAGHTMQTLEERIQKQVSWVAVEHNDHAPHRHVHILAVVQGRLQVPDFQALRQSATEACFQQRRELDLTREREGKETAWERSV